MNYVDELTSDWLMVFFHTSVYEWVVSQVKDSFIKSSAC